MFRYDRFLLRCLHTFRFTWKLSDSSIVSDSINWKLNKENFSAESPVGIGDADAGCPAKLIDLYSAVKLN